MLNDIKRSAKRAYTWWIGELRGLAADLLPGRSKRQERALVVAVSGDRIRLIDWRGQERVYLSDVPDGGEGRAPARPRDLPHAALDAALDDLENALAGRRGVRIGVRLDHRACFTRTIDLPEAARQNFSAMLRLDMERALPFRQTEVYSDHCIVGEGSAKNTVRVQQVIAKRTVLDPVVTRISKRIGPVSFADCWSADGTTPLAVDFLAADNPASPHATPWPRMQYACGVLCLMLAVSAYGLAVWRYTEAIDAKTRALEELMPLARTASSDVARWSELGKTIEDFARYSSLQVSRLRVLDALTGAIPDEAWLSRLSVGDKVVEISGYAASAVRLIPLLEQTEIFSEATLTSPVVLDPAANMEQFSIRLRLRDLTPIAGAETGAGANSGDPHGGGT